ncbi:hypothetical protein AO067_10240 [Pseudomonas viridiflava ICMP 13104]|uniref:Uncharacterized protein n=1 Tax=Pseudomonas viridiflava ICMP 13104 TaxID=1198305 RepID=A0A0W0IBS7_PSEVI|nr:hypothetical protein AO067_10240 [Pseudomonas viridiflava ICMP 13104]
MAISNLEKYRKDLDALIAEGAVVSISLYKQAYGARYRDIVLEGHGGDEAKAKAKKEFDSIKPFIEVYHHWYSEALLLVKQLLPDRLADFVRLYERPKARKEVGHDSYRIEDACQGLTGTLRGQVTVDAKTAVNLFEQQVAIVESIKRRFESSLFDIKQLVQADLFDSELDAARELLKNKFTRGAGAVAGVVLEGHLGQVCQNNAVKLAKKNPTISDYNQALKDANVIE